jgi:hypothetical protein
VVKCSQTASPQTILTITFVGRRLARREHDGSDLWSKTVKEPRHDLSRIKYAIALLDQVLRASKAAAQLRTVLYMESLT